MFLNWDSMVLNWGLMIFHKLSPSTHHNYLSQNHGDCYQYKGINCFENGQVVHLKSFVYLFGDVCLEVTFNITV